MSRVLLFPLLLLLSFSFSFGAGKAESNASGAKTLKVAFGFDKPPFVFGKSGAKGIEPDLFKAIMKPYGYRIDAVQMSKYYLEHILDRSDEYNATSSITRREDEHGIYYSGDFIFYENYVITPKSSHLTIRNLDDLAHVDFVAWNGAWHDLGPQFERYFNPTDGLYRERYHDNPSQKEDVRKFFAGEYDAIVIDKNIFQWYKTHFSNRREYDYHPIFPKKEGSCSAFRSAKLRDLFNAGLARIRANGDYAKIVQYNRTHDFTPLIRSVRLIADISSQYLYTLRADDLRKILTPFLRNRNILAIEIIDSNLNRTFLRLAKEYPRQPTDTISNTIFYRTDQENLTLGKVVVTYKKEFDFGKQNPIPDLSVFNDLSTDELNRLRTLYELHGYARVHHVDLNPSERKYLREKGPIKVHNEHNWAPYNFNENGQPKGFVIDYMNLLAQKLGIKLQYISGYTWEQFLQLARKKRIDVISNIVDTPERRKFLNFTTPYDVSKKAIFSNHSGYRHIADLKGKTVAVPRGFFIEDYLKENYPEIRLKRYDNVLQCITAVLNREADAVIESYGVIRYLMNRYNLILPYMTLSDDPELQTRLSIGVRKDEPILRDIFQKAIDSVTPKEKERLKAKWFDIQKREISPFTVAQEEYLKKLRVIRYCSNPDWKPIEFNEQGKPLGITIDTLSLVADRLHIPLKHISTPSWSLAQEYLIEGRCDLLPAATRTREREKYAYFTRSYLHYPIAIITRSDRPMVTDFRKIAGKSMARKKGSGLTELLLERYPGLKIVYTKDYKESFEKVRNGEAYFMVATLPILAYYQNNYGLKGLKVAGYLDQKMNLSMAINKKNELLYGIIDRVLAEIPPETHQIINDKWTAAPKRIETVDYSLALKILAIFTLITLVGVIAYLKLRKLNLKIDRLNRTLEQRVAEEVALNRNKDKMMLYQGRLAQMGEMISMIAHQWRQPLNNLSILMQTLVLQYRRGKLDDARVERFRSQSERMIRQMSETIDDFRNFFKPEKEKKHFVVNDAIEQVRSIMEPILRKESITLTIDAPETVTLYGYPNEFGQALLNLVSNAKDALLERNPAKKEIRLSLTRTDNAIQVTVEDSAGGIPIEILDKIFEPYFSTKVDKNGTGLGLYISKLIIEDHMGGALTAGNTTEGAQFTILFPLRTNSTL